MVVPSEQSNGSQVLLKEALEEKAGRGKEATPTHAQLGRPTQASLRQRSETPCSPLEHKKGLFLWLMQQVLLGL